MRTGFLEVPGQISTNIFVQGCKLRCEGCHSPELQSFDGGEDIPPLKLLEFIFEYKMANWVCWLGGDASYYPDEVEALNTWIHIGERFSCLYTGKTFEQLGNDMSLLSFDLIKCGPYIGKTISDDNTNQKFYLQYGIGQFAIIQHSDLEQTLKVFVAAKIRSRQLIGEIK
jgi:anaerobic ribonucleoside-triphosphate reductase activating protein